MLKTGDKLQKLIILIVTWASLLALFIAYERYFVNSQQTFLKETEFHAVERLGRELDAQIRRAQISSVSFVQLAAGDNPLSDEKLAEFLRIYFKDTWAGNHNEQIRNASILRAKQCLVRDNMVKLDSEPRGLTLALSCTDRATKEGTPATIALYTLDLTPWITRAIEPLGSNFDEVLIADASTGEVVFQKSANGPRVANVRRLLTDEATQATKPSGTDSSSASSGDAKASGSTSEGGALQKLTDTSFYLHTALGGEGYELFAVPVRANLHSGAGGNNWHLAVIGLQRSSNFDAQSHAIPYSTLIWVTLIAAAVFSLSWPIAKLRYMSNTERFTPREGWLLVLTIFLASTSVTLLLLNATYTAQAQSEVDKNLADLARRIKLHFAAEMTLAHAQLTELSPDEQVTPPTDKLSDYIAKGTQSLVKYPYFEIAFWVDRSGKQTRKFDIRPAPTPVVYVGSLPFFAKALPDPEAVLPASVAFEGPSSTTAGSDSTYYLDPGISPTTTEFTPVLASGYTRSSKGDVVQAMVVRPMSLIDPVLPPGYGFAVIDSSCAVLFHSESFRDMKENFCQESKGTSELKPWLFGGIDSAIDISYAGQPERAFISPMNIADMKAMGASSKVTMPQFAGGPAYLVVFRTADYALTLNLTIMVVCSLLLGGYFIVILLLIAFDISLRGPMQLVTAPRQMWPCSENSLKYVHIFIANAVLLTLYWLLYSQLYEAPLLALTLCLAILAPLLWFLKLSCEAKVLVRFGASLLVLSFAGLLANFIRSIHLNNSESWNDWWRLFLFIAVAGLTAILLSRSSRSNRYLARTMSQHLLARTTKFITVRFATTYSLAILTVITTTSMIPCVGCFKFAYDMISETAIKHDEIMLSKSLLTRQERIRRYYLDLIPAYSQSPSDADPNLKIKQTATRRLRETLDRYDIASSTHDFGFTYANEPGARLHATSEKKSTVREIGLSEFVEKAIGNAVLHFPANNLGTQMSKLGVAATNDAEIASDYQFDEPEPNMFILSWNRGSDLPPDFRITGAYPTWKGFLWWGYGLTLSLWIVLAFWLTSLVRKIFLTDVQPPTESADLGWTSASDIRGNYLVIGLAESGKTRDLLSIPGILPENQIDLRLKLKSLTPGAALPAPSSPGAVVVVDHFEFNLNDPDANLIRLNLMEHLLYETECRILLVSSVDPLFFFTEGAPGVITNSSDAELSRRLLDRWARVLCNFQKVRVGSGRDVEFIRRVHQFIRQHKDHRKFALLVKKECNATARLRRIGVDILDNFNDKIPLTRNLLISLVLDRAAEYYRVLWSGLTSSERLVLYQLALDGWANPKNTAALQQLESKLLICRMPMFRIMNMSFRRFVGSSEHISEIEEWEKQQKRSTWRAVRLMLVGLFLLLVVWLLHSQAALSQEVTAYVAGIATLVTAVSTLFTKSEKAVADNSSQT